MKRFFKKFAPVVSEMYKKALKVQILNEVALQQVVKRRVRLRANGRKNCWPTTPNIVGCYMLRPFAHPVACCWMLLRVVAQSLKPVKLFSQQLPTLPTMLGPRTLISHGLQRLMGCILPRYQHCWELLHPFAHHCQHARNNFQHCWRNNVGNCCVRLHAA